MSAEQEQMPLFEVVTEPLAEVEDVPSAPRGFISWADLQEQWDYKPEQFNEDHDGAMGPVDEGIEEEPMPNETILEGW